MHNFNSLPQFYEIMIATGLTAWPSWWPPVGFVCGLLLSMLQVRHSQSRIHCIHDSTTNPPEAGSVFFLSWTASSSVWCIAGWTRQLLVWCCQVSRGKALLWFEKWFLLFFYFNMQFWLFWCNRVLLPITCTITNPSLNNQTFAGLVRFAGLLVCCAIDADSLFRCWLSIYRCASWVGVKQKERLIVAQTAFFHHDWPVRTNLQFMKNLLIQIKIQYTMQYDLDVFNIVTSVFKWKHASAILCHYIHFWVCGWNPKVWQFKWNRLSSQFSW